jgi:hypothetical protein
MFVNWVDPRMVWKKLENPEISGQIDEMKETLVAQREEVGSQSNATARLSIRRVRCRDGLNSLASRADILTRG